MTTIKSQLRLICEAQSASVTRDEALGARIDGLGARIEKLRIDFFNFVSNIHQELDSKIDNTHAELMKEIKEVKEILFAHDKRIATLEHI